MKLSRNRRLTINLVIISISILVWLVLIIDSGKILGMKHCHVSTSGFSTVSLQMLLEMNPISSQLIGWGLMVIAMMLPKLIMPIQFIYMQSLKRYRFLNALLFVSGYVITWMVAGVFMIGIIIFFNLLMPMSYIPALIIIFIAIIWQYSPIKQRFLNLGHDHRILSAFGLSSMRDSLFMGFSHGISCVGSGWALMLFPMLLSHGHNLAMIIVTFIMIGEHLEHPRVPQWGFNPRLKLLKLFIAQAKIRLLPKRL
jgi:predicted metal-binding membrane protein